MHDWWCALCAAVCGQIGFIDDATVLYRQHGRNTVGSHGFYAKLAGALRWNFMFGRDGLRKKVSNLQLCFAQAEALRERMADGDGPNNNSYSEKERKLLDLAYLELFCSIKKSTWLKRYLKARKLKLSPTARARGLMFWLMLGWV